jgi:N-acetylmuramoyl-L-alanine amidase
VGKDTKKAMESWDKYLAEVQAAGEKSTDSYSSSKSTTTTKKSYATAVRSYTRTYNTRYNSRWSGSGDCWDISNAAYSRLTASGQRARIIQYANSYVGNHRSVQTWNGNTWVDYYDVPQRGVPTSRKGSETVVSGG